MSLEIISEVHPQFSGDLFVLREAIRASALSGANVVKVQLYNSDFMGKDWKYLQFTRSEFEKVAIWCEQEGVELMASVFCDEYVDWCEDVGVKRYKIASRTVVENPALCRKMLDIGKETIISLGAWINSGKPFEEYSNARYLYCIAKYPTLIEDVVDAGDFPKDFAGSGLAGYSDHTLGIGACLTAVARGATVIEKHFSLDKTNGKPTEKAHVCSMTPNELADLRRFGDQIYKFSRWT